MQPDFPRQGIPTTQLLWWEHITTRKWGLSEELRHHQSQWYHRPSESRHNRLPPPEPANQRKAKAKESTEEASKEKETTAAGKAKTASGKSQKSKTKSQKDQDQKPKKVSDRRIILLTSTRVQTQVANWSTQRKGSSSFVGDSS
eukprot:1195562-Prorocentrum_minimum.AAC.1